MSRINRLFLAHPHSVYGHPSNKQHEAVSAKGRQNNDCKEEGRSANGDHQAERLRGQILRLHLTGENIIIIFHRICCIHRFVKHILIQAR